MLEGEMIFDTSRSATGGYFPGRLNSNHMTYYPMAGSAREEVKYPDFVSPRSVIIPIPTSNRRNGNFPFGPLLSSLKTKQSPDKDANRKHSSDVTQDGYKLRYEALKAAYMDRVSPHHATASAYESYQLGKDF